MKKLIERITAEDGKIFGEYERRGFNLDGDIIGTYTTEGNVVIDVDAPLTLSFRLKGTIKQK